MNRHAPFDKHLQIRRQGFERGCLRGPDRVAAHFRDLDRIQDRTGGRQSEKAEIRMPRPTKNTGVSLLGFLENRDHLRIFSERRDIGQPHRCAENLRQPFLRGKV